MRGHGLVENCWSRQKTHKLSEEKGNEESVAGRKEECPDGSFQNRGGKINWRMWTELLSFPARWRGFCIDVKTTPERYSDQLYLLSVSAVGDWWPPKSTPPSAAQAWCKGRFPPSSARTCSLSLLLSSPGFMSKGCIHRPGMVLLLGVLFWVKWLPSQLAIMLPVFLLPPQKPGGGLNHVHQCCCSLVAPHGVGYLAMFFPPKALLHLINLVSGLDGSHWVGSFKILNRGKIGWHSRWHE